MTEDVFLSALHEAPDDDVTWLALADWLEDDGQADRAELLRLIRRLRSVPLMRRVRARAALEDRVIALLAAGVRPVVPEIINSIGLRLALIPPGRCRYGSPSSERERRDNERCRQLTIDEPFYLGVFPVTQGQYAAVTGANPSHFQRGRPGSARLRKVRAADRPNLPVDSVSWHDALAFVRQLNLLPEERGRAYRLPTEEEWEYACRGGSATTSPFHLGPSLHSGQANFNGGYPYGGAAGPDLDRTAVVGSTAPNAFGLFDMHGNVFEWCRLGDADDSAPIHIIRGGSFLAWGFGCRAAYRYELEPGRNDNYLGFRVAMNIE